MARYELNRLVEIARLEKQDAADLLLRFRERTVRDRHGPVAKPHGGGVARSLQDLAAREMPAAPQLVIVGEAAVHDRRPLGVGQAIPTRFVEVAETNVLHCRFSFYASTSTLKPPQIMRLPSNGMWAGSMSMRGSFMTSALMRSRSSREE